MTPFRIWLILVATLLILALCMWAGHAAANPCASSYQSAYPFVPKDVFLFIPYVAIPAQSYALPTQQPSQAPREELPPVATGYAGEESASTSPLTASDLNVCIRCHSASRPRGGVTLFALDGRLAPTVSWKSVYAAVKDDAMPKEGQPLTSEVKEKIHQLASLE